MAYPRAKVDIFTHIRRVFYQRNKQTKQKNLGRKYVRVVSVSELYSQLEGRGLESHALLYGNGVKAMHPILVHSINQKKYRQPNGAHQKNIFFNWGLAGQIKSLPTGCMCRLNEYYNLLLLFV